MMAETRNQDEEMDCNKHHELGWLALYGDDEDEKLEEELMSDSLQARCIPVLARALSCFVDALGVNDLHSHLSLLPSTTLSALSIESGRQGCMTEQVAYILGHHDHMERLLMCASTLASVSSCLYPCGNLQRLEFVHMASLSSPILKAIVTQCPKLTHLSLSNSPCTDPYELISVLKDSSLQVLDLSCNDWITDQWLVFFFCHTSSNHSLELLSVAKCPNVSRHMCCHLNFVHRGKPVISCKQQRLQLRSRFTDTKPHAARWNDKFAPSTNHESV